MSLPEHRIDGYRVFIGAKELHRLFGDHARYLRTADAAREQLTEHPELRTASNATELAERICHQQAALCEFLADHVHASTTVAEEVDELFALGLQDFNALLPLLGFKLTVRVPAPAIQRGPPGGVPPPRGFMS